MSPGLDKNYTQLCNFPLREHNEFARFNINIYVEQFIIYFSFALKS